jgi:hypothetical protein
MNGPEHHALVRLAFACLAADEPCGLRNLEEGVAAACMLPDQVAVPLLRGESGPWRAFFPPRLPRFNFEHNPLDIRALLPASRFYLVQSVRALRRGDHAAAARFLGVYSHYIGDFSQPAHHYELHIAGLLPPPPALRNCNYHRMLEDVPADVARLAHRSRLLGTSLGECLFRLEGRYAALYRLAVAAVVPMTRAIYRGRQPAATAALNRVVAASAALFADVLRTVAALAARRVPPAEARHLARCDLRSQLPLRWDVEFNFSRRPLLDRVAVRTYGPALPFRLRMEGSDDAPVVPGICAIPHALPLPGTEPESCLEYRLPPGVFHEFRCHAGLLAGGGVPQAISVFTVEGDGRTLWRSPPLGAADAALPVRADLSGCRRLCLRVRTDGSTDRLAYPIWGRPLLRKHPTAASGGAAPRSRGGRALVNQAG